jgi:transcription elongation factor Elf1
MKQATNEEHVSDEGFLCPYCGSGKVVTHLVTEIEGPSISRERECMICRMRWVDEYKLVGYAGETKRE